MADQKKLEKRRQPDRLEIKRTQGRSCSVSRRA
jgi:hypothetical protein